MKTDSSNARSSCHDCSSKEVSSKLSHPEMVTHHRTLQELSKLVLKLKQDVRNTQPSTQCNQEFMGCFQVAHFTLRKDLLKKQQRVLCEKETTLILTCFQAAFCPELLDIFGYQAWFLCLPNHYQHALLYQYSVNFLRGEEKQVKKRKPQNNPSPPTPEVSYFQ